MKSVFGHIKALLFAFCTFPICAVASPLTIDLPIETISLRPSDLPGYSIAQQKCGICHSADYIEYQPPGFSPKQWTGLARKMKESYGAPLSESEVGQVGEYLAATYSGQPAVESKSAIKTIERVAPIVDNPKVADAKTLLEQNGCLGCHAIDRKIVGPAYHDVAVHYKGDAQAISQIIDRISHGGAGRWGAIPMPPFPGLQPAELKQLADFVLAQ
ncbi:Cytochrome c551/c552 [Pseudomonas frederiksbergensis]|jgi:cytochrome c551/c552|uniref:Cytochrome c-551 n=1 Tax=Pseudomonas frederiksbergensis TaxID=104087 RepID=A0A1H5E5W2_9PSED|nr:c-type cytochrome [Pseudomonas frederiksbergensis]SED86525.1 Cytochrome c551/c552 [Pseudomonas frederiksbergensis]